MNEFLVIINDMRFDNADDFFVKKAYLKKKYEKLDIDFKELYKWYFFYQLCIVKNPLKEKMWDYLNDKCTSAILTQEYVEFCEKRERLY